MKKSLLLEVKRVFCVCLFLSAVAGLCGSCESSSSSEDPNPAGGGNTKSLKAAPSSLEIDAAGAAKGLAVTAQNVSWTATPDAAWLHLSVTTGTADAVIQVTADPNQTTGVLNANIVLSADGVDPVTVRVTQAGKTVDPDPTPDLEVELKLAEGYWAGDWYETEGVLDNVYLILTDRTLQGDELVGAGHVISLDLNIPATTFAALDIAGTYAPSKDLVPTTSYTFNSDEVTFVVAYDASGAEVSKKFSTDGNVKITRSGTTYAVEINFTLDDQTTLKATYSGEMKLYDDSVTYLSTLTGNCTPSLAAAEGTFSAYADSAIPSKALLLSFYGNMQQSPFDNMMLHLNVDPETQKTGAIEGEYTVLTDIKNATAADFVPGTAIPGYITPDQQSGQLAFAGSWYRSFFVNDGNLTLDKMAPFITGKVVVTRVDKEYTFTYSFTDDNTATPHTISGSYKGAIEFKNLTDPEPTPGEDITTGGNLGQWKPGGRW